MLFAYQKFKITFQPMNVTVEVDPEQIPYGVTGLPGSILILRCHMELQSIIPVAVCAHVRPAT